MSTVIQHPQLQTQLQAFLTTMGVRLIPVGVTPVSYTSSAEAFQRSEITYGASVLDVRSFEALVKLPDKYGQNPGAAFYIPAYYGSVGVLRHQMCRLQQEAAPTNISQVFLDLCNRDRGSIERGVEGIVGDKPCGSEHWLKTDERVKAAILLEMAAEAVEYLDDGTRPTGSFEIRELFSPDRKRGNRAMDLRRRAAAMWTAGGEPEHSMRTAIAFRRIYNAFWGGDLEGVLSALDASSLLYLSAGGRYEANLKGAAFDKLRQAALLFYGSEGNVDMQRMCVFLEGAVRVWEQKGRGCESEIRDTKELILIARLGR